MTPIRVVLGEDSYLAREGITRVLEDVTSVELVGTAEDIDSLRTLVERERPHVVLTDIRMPPTHTDEGIRLAAELRASEPEVGVVILSQHAEPAYAISLFEGGSGGRAYLLKERLKDPDELSRALRQVADGGSVVDPRVVEELVTSRSRPVGSPLEKLTPREREILSLIAEGRSNAAIARQLTLTQRAVERHIHTILSKLDLPESDDDNRRVRAVLMYLAGTAG